MSVALLAPPSSPATTFDSLVAGLAPLRFASVDDVKACAEALQVRVGMHVGPMPGGDVRAFLRVSPGTVAVRLAAVGQMLEVASDERLASGPVEAPELVLFELEQTKGTRAAITSWSSGSRRRMVRAIAELDLSGWADDGGVLCLVTFTLPDWWATVAPTGHAFKQLVDALRKRWLRSVATPWRGLWKLEFQRRGAPHMHTLMRVPALVGAERFEDWIRRTWADVCAGSLADDVRADYVAAGEYDRHLRRGVDLSWSGVKFSDPRRTSVYFLKHSATSGGSSKEYQNVVPDEWSGEGAGPGRFWGVWGLRPAVAELTLDWPAMVRARRILRGVARARAAQTEISRAHGANDPGAVWSMRKRRARSLTTAGGWVLVNDGVGLAYELGRALSLPD